MNHGHAPRIRRATPADATELLRLRVLLTGHRLYRSAGFEDDPFTPMTRAIDQSS